MPVLMVSLKTCPHEGFSKKRSILPFSSVMTTPNSRGSGTRLSAIVTAAPRSLWKLSTFNDIAGGPVVLGFPPRMFPVPSYASETFLAEADAWLGAFAEVVRPHVYPRGPVVLIQVDNEAAYYFRDAAYDVIPKQVRADLHVAIASALASPAW